MSPELIAGGFGLGMTGLMIVGGCVITLVTVLFIAASWVIAINIRNRMFKGDPVIREQGIPAQATVLQLGQTGLMVNDQPQVQLLLQVTPPDGEPYQTTVKTAIPMIAIPQVQPGATLPVKIHPTDRSKVILDIYK